MQFTSVKMDRKHFRNNVTKMPKLFMELAGFNTKALNIFEVNQSFMLVYSDTAFVTEMRFLYVYQAGCTKRWRTVSKARSSSRSAGSCLPTIPWTTIRALSVTPWSWEHWCWTASAQWFNQMKRCSKRQVRKEHCKFCLVKSYSMSSLQVETCMI